MPKLYLLYSTNPWPPFHQASVLAIQTSQQGMDHQTRPMMLCMCQNFPGNHCKNQYINQKFREVWGRWSISVTEYHSITSITITHYSFSNYTPGILLGIALSELKKRFNFLLVLFNLSGSWFSDCSLSFNILSSSYTVWSLTFVLIWCCRP